MMQAGKIVNRSPLLGLMVFGLSACIIPDDEITPGSGVVNNHAVRIVEELPLTAEANEACAAQSKSRGPCPQPPPSLPSHYLGPRARAYPMCICDKLAGQRDRGLRPFSFYAEDADVTDDGRPEDDLFGALFLDRNPEVLPTPEYLEYLNYLNPDDPAPDEHTDTPIGRPNPQMRQFLISDGGRFVDLCNGNRGEDSLAPGTHLLEFIVTDRRWFTPSGPADVSEETDTTGDVTTGTGPSVPVAPQIGVPDLAAGATFDIAAYVFECVDADQVPECETQCVADDDDGG